MPPLDDLADLFTRSGHLGKLCPPDDLASLLVVPQDWVRSTYPPPLGKAYPLTSLVVYPICTLARPADSTLPHLL